MKARGIIGIVGLIAILAVACKKDIRPTVRYTVIDTTGAIVEGARVYTHPCFDGVTCDTSRVNVNFIKTGLTNSSGQVQWEYPYSAIIEVFAEYYPCDPNWPPPDGEPGDTTGEFFCPFTGRTIARFESKRTSGNEENVFDVRVVVRDAL